MTWAPTSRLHVSGYRFLRRRLECALLRRDIRTVNEPLHAQGFALLAGAMLAAAAVAGCAIFGTLRPQSTLGNAPIVLAQDSGALYVRVDDVWHPVLNLASARLIAGSDVSPHLVRESALAHTKRGPLLGIPGAPPDLGEPLAPAETVWAICDSRGSVAPTTTAIVGTAAAPLVHGLAAEQTILATSAGNAPVYLLYHGQRAVMDPTDPVVARALRLEDRRPRRVSRTLLNAVPEAPPITAPRIADADGRRSSAVPGFPVGSVLRVIRADGDDYYVVLADGVQRVGQVTADLIRLSDSRGYRGITAVAPDVIGSSRILNALPVATFPDRASAPLNDDDATLCVSWTAGHTGADISFWAGQGLPLPADEVPVPLAQADNDGPALDAVYLPAGRSAYVRSAGLAGDNTPAGARYLVTNGGVRFGIRDDEAAHALGLPALAGVAPWPVLAALPQGPELSRQSASVTRDTVDAGSRTDPGPP
jgi:type VII secretion protein EccB